jgi:hypothetical protein
MVILNGLYTQVLVVYYADSNSFNNYTSEDGYIVAETCSGYQNRILKI